MAFDPNDPRIQQLLEALKTQGGGGKPLFGGAAHVQGGQGVRGMANYFKPGFAGINYNPLAAQMANGAPGLLGLNSGADTNPKAVTPPIGGPSDTGQAPPVVGHGPIVNDPNAPNPGDQSGGGVIGNGFTSPWADPSLDPYQQNPNYRKPGLQGLY